MKLNILDRECEQVKLNLQKIIWKVEIYHVIQVFCHITVDNLNIFSDFHPYFGFINLPNPEYPVSIFWFHDAMHNIQGEYVIAPILNWLLIVACKLKYLNPILLKKLLVSNSEFESKTAFWQANFCLLFFKKCNICFFPIILHKY